VLRRELLRTGMVTRGDRDDLGAGETARRLAEGCRRDARCAQGADPKRFHER